MVVPAAFALGVRKNVNVFMVGINARFGAGGRAGVYVVVMHLV